MPPLQNIFFDFRSQIGEFWCYIPKAGLNAVPTVKRTLGTPFPDVPAGNDPFYVCMSSVSHTHAGRDTRVISSNIVLDRGPGPPTTSSEPPVHSQ